MCRAATRPLISTPARTAFALLWPLPHLVRGGAPQWCARIVPLYRMRDEIATAGAADEPCVTLQAHRLTPCARPSSPPTAPFERRRVCCDSIAHHIGDRPYTRLSMHDPSRGSWIHLVDMRPHCSVNHPATHGGKRLHRDPHSPLTDVHFEARHESSDVTAPITALDAGRSPPDARAVRGTLAAPDARSDACSAQTSVAHPAAVSSTR